MSLTLTRTEAMPQAQGLESLGSEIQTLPTLLQDQLGVTLVTLSQHFFFFNLTLIRLREDRLIFSQVRLLISSNPVLFWTLFLKSGVEFWLIKFLVQEKQTHRLREQRYGCQGEGWGRDGGGVGMDMYTLLYIKWITKKVLLYITGTLLYVT